MESKIFSYKADGIILVPVDDQLSISPVFDRKELLSKLKDLFNDDDYKVDDRTLDYKIKDGQLYIEGVVTKQVPAKSIGFMGGK
ncbi:hypothetical protein [Mucilaginibacter sp. NFR10]|jgi:hypothetical protein|uniref:hypothetical protein n=1 Tax=Mucilaginibacter sp. NFR10 TaxID=1566292 RepID=UPI000871A3AE|nr:hypothetical protein [Mucilaginibacter sp. NFR10]SCW81276.1 hypothetical protein SAMN03159284_04522 [Mucilaginibacter sp. NFR10]